MKKYTLFFLLILPLTIFCQNKKASFAFEGTIGWADNIYTHNSSVPDAVVSQWQEIEKGSIGFDIGGIFNIRLNDKIEWQTGAKLLAMRTRIPQTELRLGSQHDGNGGWRPDDVEDPIFPNSIKYSYVNYYVELPLRLNLQLPGKLKAFKLSLGQSPTINFLNTSKTVEYYEDRTERNRMKDEATNFRRLSFNTQVGFIWAKELKKGNTFYLFPNIRAQTFGRAKNAALNRRYILFGLSTGFHI